MHRLVSIVSLLVLGALAGCRSAPDSSTPAAPKSAIVAELEAAGSGDISSADAASIQPWFFRQAQPFKLHVYQECAAALKKADAMWQKSDEGKSCVAVNSACVMDGCQVMVPLGQSAPR